MAERREIYKGRIIDLGVEEVELPNGVTIHLDIVRHPGASAIVAIDENGDVALIRQFRHAADGFIWEIPAGVLQPGEDPALCAARELREETGLDAAEITHLGTILPSPGFCTERIHLYLARRLTRVGQSLDHDEVLTVETMPLSRALDMIAAGEIQDGKSIAALHLAARRLGG